MANSIGRNDKIKVVALDFDGVITSLDIDWNTAIHKGSAIVGYDIKSLILFYEKNFGTPNFHKVSVEMEKLELEAIKKAPVLPHVKEALQKLAEKKIKIYIVSMQSYRVVKEFLNQHELSKFFQNVITRESCPGKKAQIEYLIRETAISPNQLLLVDDSKRNISLCSELGVTCFLFKPKQNIKDAKKVWDKVIECLND